MQNCKPQRTPLSGFPYMRNTILTVPCPLSKHVRSVCGNHMDIPKRSIGRLFLSYPDALTVLDVYTCKITFIFDFSYSASRYTCTSRTLLCNILALMGLHQALTILWVISVCVYVCLCEVGDSKELAPLLKLSRMATGFYFFPWVCP